MTKRATVAILFGLLLAALTIPSIALAQEGQETSGEGEATTDPVTQEEPVVTEETSGEEATVEEVVTEEAEEAAVEPQVATTDGSDSSTSAAGAQTASDASVTTGTQTIRTTNGKKAKRSSRKGKKSGKSCSASRSAGGPVAQASAPVAAGCTRMGGGNGALVLPDGTTLTITETSQGVINFTVSGGPTGTFSGTLFVKGGPSDPGFACTFNGVTAGSCNTPVNPNNGKFFGVSHVDACPGVFVPPGPQPDSGRRDDDDRTEEQREEERERRAARRARQVPVAAAAVAAPGGQLPVTGLPVIALVLVGGGLIASGFTLRRLT